MCNNNYQNQNNLFLLVLIVLFTVLISAHPPPPFQLCLARCVAKCFKGAKDQSAKVLSECQTKCRPYGQPHFCDSKECWRRCKNLDPPGTTKSSEEKGPGGPHHPLPPPPPKGIEASYNANLSVDVRWEPGPGMENGGLYLLELETEVPNHQITQIFTSDHSFSGMIPSSADSICGPITVQVAQVDAQRGLSKWSKPVQLDNKGPAIGARMELAGAKFNSTPFDSDDYTSNATINIELKFTMKGVWPLGIEDLEVAPVFHLLGCAVPDLGQAFPAPDFHRGTSKDTVQTFIGADLMYRRCRFVYAVDEVRSNHCGATYRIVAGEKDFQTLELNCDTVSGSNCIRSDKTKSANQAPMCGQFDKFEYKVTETETYNSTSKDSEGENEKIAVNISFKAFRRIEQMKPMYYVALFGNAQNYQNEDEKLLLGVNMTDVLGERTNCAELEADHSCKRISAENSIVLDGLSRNKTYGVLLCAILDPHNLSFPNVNVTEKYMKPKAFGIFVPDEEREEQRKRAQQDYKTKKLLRWVFGGVGVLLALLVIACAGIFLVFRRQQDKLRKKKLRLEESMQRQRGQRYTDFPARTREDPWELERRNLITYEDKRLGSGAFGSVYLGKLVGLQKNGGQLSNSLSIGLMRAENPYVAVKMLPEYADELSKSDFLREIGLMKSLGYHERLVNMLACLTQSEPYCLVVEYCSDGDLLQFLRSRCKYMLELDEAGIKYSEPNCEAEFEASMIMTIKQLLMFAVQISYGLEYLSQKGFVHRDVAARNILVQDKTHAKIGDFGLCRFIYADSANYKGRGGRLPIKWMSPEAIRHYEFTTSSDVWSFGVLMFEIITLGGTPYPGIQPDDMLPFLVSGRRMAQPDNCPDDFYRVMCSCWAGDSRLRPDFAHIRQQLALQLENVSDEYAYLKLDAQKDYYNVSYGELRAQRGCESFESEESPDDNERAQQSSDDNEKSQQDLLNSFDDNVQRNGNIPQLMCDKENPEQSSSDNSQQNGDIQGSQCDNLLRPQQSQGDNGQLVNGDVMRNDVQQKLPRQHPDMLEVPS